MKGTLRLLAVLLAVGALAQAVYAAVRSDGKEASIGEYPGEPGV